MIARPPETFYHVTVLSNLVRGYDKYRQRYSKRSIPESTYPDRFFLLRRDELSIGREKAGSLLRRLGLPNNRLIVLETQVPADLPQPNLRNGLGRFILQNWIPLAAAHDIAPDGGLTPLPIEDACADSFSVLQNQFAAYDQLTPRSFSVLPEAIGCQASCSFCFSKTSVSLEQKKTEIDWRRLGEVMREARRRGAERAVITGGGEPGMRSDEELERLTATLAQTYSKIVLITNGYKWSQLPAEQRLERLRTLQGAGLSVMAISRHHHDPQANAEVMRLDTQSEKLAESAKQLESLKLRWVCVLQRGGVEDEDSLTGYLDWASSSGVREICFKELYVSTSRESEYHDYKANRWSRQHQVSLRLITDFAERHQWRRLGELPWGAPVYKGDWRGVSLRIAAYTEPSLFWERSQGLCRSWNLMADGRCLASLEDRQSEVLPR